jgi:hypothetical protein
MPGAITRAAALLCAAALLGGCNIVVSRTPMFAQADTAGAPAFRPGLWVGEKDDCRFDEAAPADKWPDCAEPVMVAPGEIRGVGAQEQKTSTPYLLAAGDPLVLQAQTDLDLSAKAEASASGDGSASAAVAADASAPRPFVFLGVHPLAFDRQGRITRMEQWPVMCGPPPPEPKAGSSPAQGRYVTRDPLPGLTVEGEDCTPASKAAVINAARQTRAYSQIQTSHWVRDTAP